MARLTRVHQKVFASNASNNGVFGSLQAGNPTTSNDVATLQSLSAFENGWDDAAYSGDKLPPLEEFQGIQYGISYQQAYMLQEGIAEWEASTPYYKGSLAKTISGTSFKLYCSLTDNNTGNIVTNTTYWKLVMDSDAGYFVLSDNNTATGNNTFSGAVSISGATTVSGNITSSGTNSFTGTNTFNHLYSSSGSLIKGTTPLNNTYLGLYFTDKNGTNYTANQMGQLQLTYGSDGSISLKMNCIKPEANSTDAATFGIGYEADGTTQYATASSGVRKDIVSWGMPNYSGGSSKSASTSYTATSNGFLYLRAHRSSGSSGSIDLTINGVTLKIHSQDYDWNTCMVPVGIGSTYSYILSGISESVVTFYPCSGG